MWATRVLTDRRQPTMGVAVTTMVVSRLVGFVALVGLVVPLSSALAAEAPLPPPVARAHRSASCGPCGCLHVGVQYHRVLESTYGTAFDPRNDDQTEPYYYWGRVRAYPRYFVDGVPLGTFGWCDQF
jgi:hypothetical protein